MRNRLTDEEKVLQFLINKNNHSIKNNVTINSSDVNTLKLTSTAIIIAVNKLQTDRYLKITRRNNDDNFDVYWEFELTSNGLHYFENKNEIKIKQRNDWIQFWIPVGLSILALIIAALSLLLDMQRI